MSTVVTGTTRRTNSTPSSRPFDEGEVSVDELFVKLERATAIIETLEARLDATKAKVDELAPRLSRVLESE